MVRRFRKKSIEILAIQLTWENWSDVCDFAGVGPGPQQPKGAFVSGDSRTLSLVIPTLEGDMVALENDWIIRGVKGELYPCKSDIFEKSYDSVG